METVRVKKCCAICEYLYHKADCPLYHIYKDSEYNDVFSEKGQYKMLCDEFEVNSKLVEEAQDDEYEDESGQ